MSFLIGNEILFIPSWASRFSFFPILARTALLIFLHKRSLGSREEVLHLMDQMFIDTDRKSASP